MSKLKHLIGIEVCDYFWDADQRGHTDRSLELWKSLWAYKILPWGNRHLGGRLKRSGNVKVELFVVAVEEKQHFAIGKVAHSSQRL